MQVWLEDVPNTKRTQVLGRLYRAILEGYLRPGQVINESHLAEHLKVSRTPVREALSTLVQEGLLVSRGQRGLQVINITEDVVEQIFAVRIPLELIATKLICESEAPVEFDGILTCLERADEAWEKGNIPSLVQANTEFHHALVLMSGNQYLQTAMRGLLIHASLAMMASLTLDLRPIYTLKEHRCLVDALRDKDKQAASRIVKEHLENAKCSALTHLKGNPLLEGLN